MSSALTRTNRHPSSARFVDILTGCIHLHDEKQRGYGKDDDPFANVRASQRFGVEPWRGALMRLNDKMERLANYCLHGELPFESVEDNLRDIIVYAGICLVLFEEDTYGDTTAADEPLA